MKLEYSAGKRPLLGVGKHLYLKDRAKVDNTDEVKKTVMSDMRLLATVLIAFMKEGDGTEACMAMYEL